MKFKKHSAIKRRFQTPRQKNASSQQINSSKRLGAQSERLITFVSFWLDSSVCVNSAPCTAAKTICSITFRPKSVMDVVRKRAASSPPLSSGEAAAPHQTSRWTSDCGPQLLPLRQARKDTNTSLGDEVIEKCGDKQLVEERTKNQQIRSSCLQLGFCWLP